MVVRSDAVVNASLPSVDRPRLRHDKFSLL